MIERGRAHMLALSTPPRDQESFMTRPGEGPERVSRERVRERERERERVKNLN